MSGRPRTPTGVVCDDRATVRRSVSALMVRCGISVAGEADAFVPLLRLVLLSHPAVAVVTLPVAGTSGMTAVSAVRAASPGCEVVVLSVLGNLELAAGEAGALAVLREEDPQALREVLLALVQRAAVPADVRAPRQGTAPSSDSCETAGSAGRSTTKPAS